MKRYMHIRKYVLTLLLSMCCLGCDGLLEEELYSELGADNYLTTQAGINSVLNGSYNSINEGPQSYMYRLLVSMLCSGVGWGRGGFFEQEVVTPMLNFRWHSNTYPLESWWDQYFDGIRNANIVIDYVDNDAFSNDFKAKMTAEAKALRGYFYYQLYTLFGPVPIFIDSNPAELKKPRATDEEIRNRIETDLREAADALPIDQELGRVTKGAALGMLCKFYLNTKQWQKCVDVAREIINLGVYGLVPDYKDIYSHQNEGHEEILWVVPALSAPNSESTNIIAITTPPDYPLPPGQLSYAARTYVYDSFIASFDNADTRKDLIEQVWVNVQGQTINGYGNNLSLFFKYPIDPNASGDQNGIDFISVRYADILLSLAEALNEQNGPNQESIDLINGVRDRAKVYLLDLADYPTKESLRDHILNERFWEFYFEKTEREDLIRHGKFVSGALVRGISAARDYHVRFPIPQREVDANPVMVQNAGY